MRPSTRVHRALAVSASAGLVSALAWLPAGPASAAVANTLAAAANVSSEFTGVGAFNCDLTSGEDSVLSTEAQFSSGVKTRSARLDATFTSEADPSDITRVTGHFKGDLNVSKHHGDLAAFTLAGSGNATVSRAKGNASQCATSVFAGVEATTDFTETKPGWLYVTRDTSDSAESAIFAFNKLTNQTVLFEEFFGGASRSTERAFLTPSSYGIPELVVGVDNGLLAAAKTGSTRPGDLASRMTGTFIAAGSAFSTAHGAGTAFVRFPGAISCRHHSARLTLTGRAGRLASASFFVNGAKVATVSHPKAGKRVALRALGARADNKITARMMLAGGGRVSATRRYVPCLG